MRVQRLVHQFSLPPSHPMPYIADVAGIPLLCSLHCIANAFSVRMLRCGIKALFALAHAETSLAVINGVYLRGSCIAVSESRALTADGASPARPGSSRRWRGGSDVAAASRCECLGTLLIFFVF